MSRDQQVWADQLRMRAEDFKTCMGSQVSLNPKWIEDVQREIDELTAHTIMLMQARSEGELK